MKYSDVFVPGGFPQHTYNPRGTLRLEDRLREITENLCKLATVTGHTKSGKTVLVRKVLSPEESIWVDGGIVSEEDDLWHIIIDKVGLFQETSESSDKTMVAETSAEASAGANLFVAKGQGKVGGKIGTERASGTASARSLSSRVVALQGLKETRLPLVIDDFHYLPQDMQGALIRALKPLIFDGLPVVIIAIPHHRYDAMKVEREMTGRIFPIEIPMWSEAELTFIPDKGFRLLNQVVPPEIIQTLTAEAIGSPHLMQDFCRAICRQAGVNEASSESTTIFLGDEKVTRVFHDVAESIGRPIFEKLASGPRQRSDRVQRVLKDGREVDIYQLVLLALADLRPGLITLEYEELRSAIRELSASRIPQIHEIVRVLKHMAVIAATDHSSTPVVDFEENEKKLHITDPFFAFYLRWGNLAAVIQDRRRPLVEPLTNRELDILELLAQQLNNKEIAEKLFISNSTVKAHLVNIYRKLNVPNRREAIEKTMKIGILSGR